jgi:hypothetical protein
MWLTSLAPFGVYAQRYKHKSEGEIASMTPAQRVDEWVNEQVHHRYDVLDDQEALLRKYVTRDGLKGLPRLTEIMDEYDPTRFPEGKGRRGERFDASVLMFIYIDRQAVRVRASEEGRGAMDAVKRAIDRMRAAGYERKDQHEWKWVPDGRLEAAVAYLQESKGTNDTDEAIRHTLRLEYRIRLGNAELLEFSNFLVSHYPEYPSWSDAKFFRDYTDINEAGIPLPVRTMKKPEPFYQAYLEFKKK